MDALLLVAAASYAAQPRSTERRQKQRLMALLFSLTHNQRAREIDLSPHLGARRDTARQLLGADDTADRRRIGSWRGETTGHLQRRTRK